MGSADRGRSGEGGGADLVGQGVLQSVESEDGGIESFVDLEANGIELIQDGGEQLRDVQGSESADDVVIDGQGGWRGCRTG